MQSRFVSQRSYVFADCFNTTGDNGHGRAHIFLTSTPQELFAHYHEPAASDRALPPLPTQGHPYHAKWGYQYAQQNSRRLEFALE